MRFGGWGLGSWRLTAERTDGLAKSNAGHRQSVGRSAVTKLTVRTLGNSDRTQIWPLPVC
jgi:hypothetical protein